MNIEKNAFVERQLNSLSIQVVGGGYVRTGSEWSAKGVCSPFSRLFFVTKGSGNVVVGEKTTRLLPGFIYLIPIGLTHDYYCEEYMEKLWFHINIEFYDGIDLFTGLTRCYEMPTGIDEVLSAAQSYLTGRMSDALLISGLIYSTISRFAEMSGVNDRPMRDYSPLLKGLFAIVRSSLTSRTTARQLAQALAVSESTLTKRFRAETGQTLGRYLDMMLMHRARQLLLSSKSIGEVAEQLEFCDQFYFSRFFRLHQGDTPSAYRRRMRENL